MITVNILGSCVIRDAFAYGEAINEKRFKVNKFLQGQTLFSIFAPPLSSVTKGNIEAKDMIDLNSIWYRWALADTEKTALEQIKYSKSDYLFIGFEEILYDILKISNKTDNDKNTYISPDLYCGKALEIFSKEKFSDINIERISTQDFVKTKNGLKYLNFCLDKISEEITRMYDLNHIILVEYFFAKSYISKKNTVELFNEKNSYAGDKLIQYCDQYFLKKVPCYVVKLPADSFADEKHKWGLASQHFVPKVYAYLYEEFCSYCR